MIFLSCFVFGLPRSYKTQTKNILHIYVLHTKIIRVSNAPISNLTHPGCRRLPDNLLKFKLASEWKIGDLTSDFEHNLIVGTRRAASRPDPADLQGLQRTLQKEKISVL